MLENIFKAPSTGKPYSFETPADKKGNTTKALIRPFVNAAALLKQAFTGKRAELRNASRDGLNKAYADGKSQAISNLVESVGDKPTDCMHALGWAWGGLFPTPDAFPNDVRVAKDDHCQGASDFDHARNNFNNALRGALVAKLSPPDREKYKELTAGLTQKNYLEIATKVTAWVEDKAPTIWGR